MAVRGSQAHVLQKLSDGFAPMTEGVFCGFIELSSMTISLWHIENWIVTKPFGAFRFQRNVTLPSPLANYWSRIFCVAKINNYCLIASVTTFCGNLDKCRQELFSISRIGSTNTRVARGVYADYLLGDNQLLNLSHRQ